MRDNKQIMKYTDKEIEHIKKISFIKGERRGSLVVAILYSIAILTYIFFKN